MSSNPTTNSPSTNHSDSDVVIRVSNLSKVYQIYERPQDRLKQSLFPRFQRLMRRRPSSYYREFWSLKDVSFEIKKGETVGIVGRNGAGKSTLLQIICGTLTPSSGSVEINGRVAALLELGSGFNPEFTGRENVYMNAAVLGLTKEEIDEKYADIVAFADIGEFISQPVKSYSSGMMVRLAFAVIAHVDADILVIDEALSVGDAFFSQKCIRFLRKFMETGAVLFVSHDTGAVMNLCNRAVVLEESRVVKTGSPKAVVEYYLSSLYKTQQDIDSFDEISDSKNEEKEASNRDMRTEWINHSKYRNDIEVFKFDPNQEGFGSGGAKVTGVKIYDAENIPLSWIVGGEEVVLAIDISASKNLYSYIIGFQVKDRLGQIVFGDNTFITYMTSPLSLSSGESARISFRFIMPVLPSGSYSIAAAIAEGTQEKHTVLHWIHDAMILNVHASVVCHGLIQVPVIDINVLQIKASV